MADVRSNTTTQCAVTIRRVLPRPPSGVPRTAVSDVEDLT